VIAIVPQIGTGILAAPPSPQTPPTSNAAAQPFSAVLEQANQSPSDSLGTQAGIGTQAGTGQGFVQGNSSLVSSPAKRDAKSPETKASDSKTNGSQGHGDTLAQLPAPSPDTHDKTAPVVVAQPVPLAALPWNAGIKDFIPDTLVTSAALSDQSLSDKVPDTKVPTDATLSNKTTAASDSASASASKPEATGGSTSLPTLSKDVVPAKRQGDASPQDSANPAGASPATAKPTSTETGDAGVVTSLIANLSGTVGSDSKAQTASAPATSQVRNVSRGTGETTDGVNKAQAPVKAEIEPVLVPPTGVAPVVVPPTPGPGKVEPGTQGIQAKSALDKSRVSVTQDSSGAARKNIEVTGGAKAQPRKDDSPSSANSQTDQGMGSAPAKAVEPAPSFSAAGIQPSPTTGEGKSASASVPREGGDQQAGQLEEKSTGVVQGQAQGETAAVYPTSLVHSAKLVERIGEAELRLGIRAGEFGSVDIRTSMVRNQFTAEISVERGELGRLMAAELPSLQNRLAEQRVPVTNITIQDHTGSNSSASEQQKPRDGRQVYETNPAGVREQGLTTVFVAPEVTAPSSSRLDVHM
jgi:flagellar hook-length control protein FliK